jgi:hypothetical protein
MTNCEACDRWQIFSGQSERRKRGKNNKKGKEERLLEIPKHRLQITLRVSPMMWQSLKTTFDVKDAVTSRELR